MNWSDEIVSRIDIAFWIQTPLEEQLWRIQSREEKRLGSRVFAGGDMFEQQTEFRKKVENLGSESVEENALGLRCHIFVIDGTLSVTKKLEKITDSLNIFSFLGC